MANSDQFVTLDQSKPVALLTFERPYSLNRDGLLAFRETLQALADIRSTRALIITGKAEESLLADVPSIRNMNPLQAAAFSSLGQETLGMLETLPFPTIAAINGMALGGGCEIALACDMAFASESAKFGQIECKGGILPGFGGTKRLPRRVGQQRAREMIFTGSVISARKAKEYGLILDVIESSKLLEHCHELAQQIADNPQLAVAEAKRVLTTNDELPLEAAMEVERRAFALLFATKDQKEAMAAFIEKRAPVLHGE